MTAGLEGWQPRLQCSPRPKAPWVGLLPTVGWRLGHLFALWDWGLSSCRTQPEAWLAESKQPVPQSQPASQADSPCSPVGLSPLYTQAGERQEETSTSGALWRCQEIDQVHKDANPQGSSTNLHISDEETEAQRGYVTCPKSHS